MEYPCEVKYQQAKPILSLRTRTPIANMRALLGEAYQTIERYLESLGEDPDGPPFVIYYNMDMQDLDVEIGFPVRKPLPGAADLKAGVLPAGKVASCLYTGAYSGLPAAYQALSEWMMAQHVEPTGVAIEFYLSDPDTTAPDKLQTQIVYPLRAA